MLFNDVNASPLIEVKMYLTSGMANAQKGCTSHVLLQEAFLISASMNTKRVTSSYKRAWGLFDPDAMSVTVGFVNLSIR